MPSVVILACLDGKVDVSIIYTRFHTLVDVVESTIENKYGIPLGFKVQTVNLLIDCIDKLQQSTARIQTLDEEVINLADYLGFNEMKKLIDHSKTHLDISLIMNDDIAISVFSVNNPPKNVLKLCFDRSRLTSNDKCRELFKLSQTLSLVPTEVFQKDYARAHDIRTSTIITANGVIRDVCDNESLIVHFNDELRLKTATYSIFLQKVKGFAYVISIIDNYIHIYYDGHTSIFKTNGTHIHECDGEARLRGDCIFITKDNKTIIHLADGLYPFKVLDYKIVSAGKYYFYCSDYKIKAFKDGTTILDRNICYEMTYCEAYNIDLLIYRGDNIQIFSIKGEVLFRGGSANSTVLDTYVCTVAWLTYSCVHWPSGVTVFTDKPISESLINGKLVFRPFL